jgi:hypothetical protein
MTDHVNGPASKAMPEVPRLTDKDVEDIYSWADNIENGISDMRGRLNKLFYDYRLAALDAQGGNAAALAAEARSFAPQGGNTGLVEEERSASAPNRATQPDGDDSPLVAKALEIIARTRDAEKLEDEACDAAIDALQAELQDLDAQIPRPPRSLADLWARALVAYAGGEQCPDGTLKEAESPDIFEGPAARLVEDVIQFVGGGLPAGAHSAGGGAPSPGRKTLGDTRDWQLRNDAERLVAGLCAMQVLIHSRRDKHGCLDQDATNALEFCVDSLIDLSDKIDELLETVEVRCRAKEPANASAAS